MRLLAAVLARLADHDLAQSIAGDLEEGYRRRLPQSRVRAIAWCTVTATGLVWHVAISRLGESARELSPFRWRGVWAEARQAARALLGTPVVTGVVIATLALGFGLNTAIFSVVHGVLFRPLPFARADEIVIVEGVRSGGLPSLMGTSYPDYQDFNREQRTFQSLAASAYWTFTVKGPDAPLRVVGQRVTGSFFPLLGMRPEIGRWIDAADDRRGGPEVVVLSHAFWQRVFGGDRNVVGRDLALNGAQAEIIGVMPEAFRFPFEDVELWAPAVSELDTIPRRSRFIMTLGRLRPRTTVAEAREDLTRIAVALEAQHPDSNTGWRPALREVVPALTKAARPRLVLLFVAVIVVLLVACVNVTTLILARAAARRHELVLRVALGASRRRLARVLLLESCWFGVAGLGAGLLLATPAVTVLKRLAPPGLPRLSGVELDWTVAGWAALAMVAFIGIGALAPLVSLRLFRQRGVASATVAGRPRTWGRRALIVSQIAGAFALLVAAGLLTRSFSRVLAVDPGFDPHNLATMRAFLTPPVYRTAEQQLDYVARALEALRTTPGVTAAAAVSQPPFDAEGAGSTLSVAIEGRSYAPGSQPLVAYRATSASYFHTVGVEVIDGRGLSDDDRRGGPLVAVINQSMARRLWPGERPVGRRFEFADGRDAGWLTVVGVVGDVATDGLETTELPAVYAPYQQRTLPFLRWMTFVVRTERDVEAEIPAVRARLQSVDSRQPLYAVRPIEDEISRSVAERRFSVTLIGAFAGLTLVLAAMGLYGTLAQAVAEQSREIGVRLALGAMPMQVFRKVMAVGAGLTALGVVVGVAVVWLGLPLIRQSLFGVSAGDAWTYIAIGVLLSLTTVAACAIPARLAARVDPVQALRGQ